MFELQQNEILIRSTNFQYPINVYMKELTETDLLELFNMIKNASRKDSQLVSYLILKRLTGGFPIKIKYYTIFPALITTQYCIGANKHLVKSF